MAEKAHVASVEALEIFRANLIVFQTKTRPTLEQVRSEILRTRDWLQHDQTNFWKNQIRRRRKVLEEAQNALFTAKMANPTGVPDAEQMAFRRAKRSVDEAEAKLRCVRRWMREFDHLVDPLIKKFDRLQNYLASDMPRAIAFLSRAVETLVDYSGSAFGQNKGLGQSPAAEDQGGDSLSQSDTPDSNKATEGGDSDA